MGKRKDHHLTEAEKAAPDILTSNVDDRCAPGGLLEALRWTASALTLYTRINSLPREERTVRMTETGEVKTIAEILDMADAAIGKAEGSALVLDPSLSEGNTIEGTPEDPRREKFPCDDEMPGSSVDGAYPF